MCSGGLRVYTTKTEIPRVLGGLGLVIMSTSKGIMSGKRAKREGFVTSVEELKTEGPQGTLRVQLKYGPEKEKVITGLRRISRPGLRVYKGRNDIPQVMNGLGVAIVSTPQGVMTDRKARATGVGGEVICYVA